MTVSQLLQHADSYELSAWQSFLKFDMERRDEMVQRAKTDAQYEG